MTTNFIKTIALFFALATVSWSATAGNETTKTEKVFASAIATPVTPAQKEIVSLHFANEMQNAQLTLCNSTGEVVKTISNINGLDVIIDKAELDNEVYYFTLTNSLQNSVVGKLVIQ
jgi:hypothetical protein